MLRVALRQKQHQIFPLDLALLIDQHAHNTKKIVRHWQSWDRQSNRCA
jgi:hypothetical protein